MYIITKLNRSASLKKVLPAFLPHMNYDELGIKEGGSASQAYLNLLDEIDDVVVLKIRNASLEYCKMDTLAMVQL